MNLKISTLLLLLLTASVSSCKKDDPEEPAESTIYLDSWVGTYRGSALFTDSDPDFNSDPVEVITTSSVRDVKATVTKTDIDSTLTLMLTYDDTLVVNLNEYQFSEQGIYYYSGSGSSGSGFGSLDIQFGEDVMNYTSSFQSGMFTNNTIEFSIPKQCSE